MLCANGLAKTMVNDAPIKNEGGTDVAGAPPSKKLRLSNALSFFDAATIQTDILVDLPLLMVNGKSKDSNLILRIRANSTLYLVNAGQVDTSDKDATITQGSLLVGLGKGKWQTTITVDAKDIKYELKESTDHVIFHGNITTVGTLVTAKRLTTEADISRVCYHDIVDKPTPSDKAAFYLRHTQDVFYSLSDVQVKRESGNASKPEATQSSAASLVPPEAWITEFTSMHWIVKWMAKKGLQPTRPQITWTAATTTIPDGKVLQLTP